MRAADTSLSSEPDEPDDERTVSVPANSGAALPFGYALQEFVIDGVLGEGGFGIVYLAHDTRLRRQVAVKEYMPASLAGRRANLWVAARSESQRETFDVGLRSFVNEAQLLASFDHPSLVKVYRFWEQNGTAYMVMPLYKGVTLKQWLRDSGAKPDEASLLGLLYPLTDALERLHRAEPCCLHRDVSPDNILLLGCSSRPDAGVWPTEAQPLLLDFGAARRVIGDMTQSLTVFLKHGYAPVEQYGDTMSMKQGPWTDVYALSAVLYACVAGRAPAASVDRILADDMLPATQVGAGRYSARFLGAIDAGLQVRPEQRPQSMLELRALFVDPQDAKPATRSRTTVGGEAVRTPRAPQAHVARPGATSKLTRRAWGVAAVAMASAVGVLWWVRKPAGPATTLAEVAPANVGSRPIEAAATPAVGADAPQASSTSAVATPPANPAPPQPFSVLAALQDIVDRADPALAVQASVDKPTLVIGKDSLRFRVRSSEPGHVYVFSGGTDKSHFHLLFPNRLDKLNRIGRGAELALPRKGWEITAEGPEGTNHIVVVVSREERNFAQAGLRQTDTPIPEFDLAQAERQWAQRRDGVNPFVGNAMCATPGCSGTFGAAMLQVDEVAAAPAKPRN